MVIKYCSCELQFRNCFLDSPGRGWGNYLLQAILLFLSRSFSQRQSEVELVVCFFSHFLSQDSYLGLSVQLFYLATILQRELKLLSVEIQLLEKFCGGLWGWSQGALLDLFMSLISHCSIVIQGLEHIRGDKCNAMVKWSCCSYATLCI